MRQCSVCELKAHCDPAPEVTCCGRQATISQARAATRIALSRHGLGNRIKVKLGHFEREDVPVVTILDWRPDLVGAVIKLEVRDSCGAIVEFA